MVLTDHDQVTTLDGRAPLLVIPGIELTNLHVNALFVDPALAGTPLPRPSSSHYDDAVAARARGEHVFTGDLG